jgi:hypothetical protein
MPGCRPDLENMSGDAPIYDQDDGSDYGDNPAA